MTRPTLRPIRPPMGAGSGLNFKLTDQSFPSTLRLRISGDIIPPRHAFTTLRGTNLTFTYLLLISRLYFQKAKYFLLFIFGKKHSNVQNENKKLENGEGINRGGKRGKKQRSRNKMTELMMRILKMRRR